MAGDPRGIESLKEYSEGLYSKIEYESDDSNSTLEIDNGVLFLMAFWSAPAVVGFRNMCRELKLLEWPEGFRVCVLDIDGLNNCADFLLEHRVTDESGIRGNGEGFWFKNGEIFEATVGHKSSPERIQEIMKEIGRA